MTCDCSTPENGVLGELWQCGVCGSWWVAFLRYDEDGCTVWWDPVTRRSPSPGTDAV